MRWSSSATGQMLLLGVLLAAFVGATGCGSSSSESGGKATTVEGTGAEDHGSEDVSGMDEVSMELDDNYFEPTVLEGEPGQKLQIELENEGGNEHNFSVDEQSIDQDVDSGKTATVTVTFPQSGTIRFYCKYHERLGMVGDLRGGSLIGDEGTLEETTPTVGRGYP